MNRQKWEKKVIKLPVHLVNLTGLALRRTAARMSIEAQTHANQPAILESSYTKFLVRRLSGGPVCRHLDGLHRRCRRAGRGAADMGREAVRKTVVNDRRLVGLATAAEGKSAACQLIAAIPRQTNLLALNATIEAGATTGASARLPGTATPDG
ncbi:MULTISPECIES: hypothetical protein [unclassified Bradyrhizobium]|uniref:hypothetical protein n=1 Tax=unclassified Bradyrhizobium TaxID=2631580 RepID=UPI0033964DC1